MIYRSLRSLLKHGARSAQSPSMQTWLVNLVILFTGVVNSVLMGRWIGAEGRGNVAIVLLWPMLFTYLASFGFTDATLYFAALPGSNLGAVRATSFAAALIQSAIALPVAYALVPLLVG